MSDTISNRLREQATLYVLDALSETEKTSFEKSLEKSPQLQSLVEELSATLKLTEPVLSFHVDETELEGQRNLLRGRIDQLEIKKSESPRWSNFLERLDRISAAIFTPRQPAWAVVSYIALAFFIGRWMVTDSQPATGSMDAGFTANDIIELIQAGSLSDVDLKESETGGIQLAVERKDEVNVTGGYQDESIQQVLFFMLLNDANPGKRLKAVNLMKKIPRHDNKKLVLVSSILTESNPGVRLRALEQLSDYEEDKVILDACLKLVLEDDNEAVRMGALGILAKYPTANIVPALRVVSLMDKNDFIKNKAKEILDNFDDLATGETIEVNR